MLPQLRVASPCTADWEKMIGDDRVRYCDRCKLNVYNFAEMSASEIEQLLPNNTRRVCGRLYQRFDGTVLTKDCPAGFRARVRQVSRIAGAALAAMMITMPASAQNSSKISAIHAGFGSAGVRLTIVDPSGAVISGASVTISEQTGARVMQGESDSVGAFEALALKRGSWKITVYKAGFAQKEVTVTLREGSILEPPITLELGVAVMGGIIKIDSMDLEQSTYPMPNSISSDSVSPTRPKSSRNPISRLLHKLHF